MWGQICSFRVPEFLFCFCYTKSGSFWLFHCYTSFSITYKRLSVVELFDFYFIFAVNMIAFSGIASNIFVYGFIHILENKPLTRLY